MAAPKPVSRKPLFFIALPAAVAVWSGWVGLGGLCGFGPIHPFPGIPRLEHFVLNTAITLPIGIEAYGLFAMNAWLRPGSSDRVKRFACRSSIGSLGLGMLGQIAYHLMSAAHMRVAPWFITMLVACLPVVSLGFGAALAHLLRSEEELVVEEASSEEPPSAPQKPLEELTARTVPSMSTYSTATSELLSSLPKATADETSAEEPELTQPEPEREPVAAAPAPARTGAGSHAAPRSRSWSRDRRARAIVSNARSRGEEITGAELGRKLGVTARHGQRLMQSMDSI